MASNSNNVSLSKETIENIKQMNDKEFFTYVRNNWETIENIIYSIPKNLYKKGQIHPEEIFNIIITEDYDEGNDEGNDDDNDDDITINILRDYLINKK